MNIRDIGSELGARGRAFAGSSSASASRAAARMREALPSAADATHALERVPSPRELWEHYRGHRRDTGLPLLLAAVVTGTVASMLSAAVLAVMARLEGKAPLQPLNATSHWRHGPVAGKLRGLDLEHTGLGFLTHHASAVFWALPFQWWLGSKPERSPAEVIAGAGAVAGIAAAVDYGLLPHKATPGWEHAVSPRSMAAGFGALAVGLAVGGLLTEALRQR